LKIRSSPPARRPSEEESQRPAGQQADRKDHGEKGHYSPAHSLEKPRRHEVVGGDQQQLMGQHAASMADRTVTSGGRTALPATRWRAHNISGSISNFLSLLAVRVARNERQEIVQRHGEITPGAALCIAVECAAVISEPGLFDR
jgi:hypothetical protein